MNRAFNVQSNTVSDLLTSLTGTNKKQLKINTPNISPNTI